MVTLSFYLIGLNFCFFIKHLLCGIYIIKGYVRTNALFALTGSTVELKCMYTANAGLVQRLLWRRGTTLLSENTILENTDVRQRLKITGDHSIGEYHLNISDIRQSDQATYKCSISKTTKVHSQQLIVIGEYRKCITYIGIHVTTTLVFLETVA